MKVSKPALNGVFGNKKLTETEFSTAIKLAQNRMNSRPLVGLSNDPKDDDILTITPHHLKLGRPIAMLPSTADKMNESDVADTKLLFLIDGPKENLFNNISIFAGKMSILLLCLRTKEQRTKK